MLSPFRILKKKDTFIFLILYACMLLHFLLYAQERTLARTFSSTLKRGHRAEADGDEFLRGCRTDGERTWVRMCVWVHEKCGPTVNCKQPFNDVANYCSMTGSNQISILWNVFSNCGLSSCLKRLRNVLDKWIYTTRKAIYTHLAPAKII